MVASFKKNTALMLLIGLIVALFVSFVPTNVAFADGDIPKVIVNDNGGITIDGGGFKQDSGKSSWNQIIEKYRGFIVGISGIAAITMVVIFIIQFLKLGASAGNPQARSQALTGVLWSGIAAAGLGAVSLIVGLFYNAI
ncbi:hypothetical protein ACFVS2_22015 [Brevibacillus sp. NPDC058079]|uniref:hypothetical protein n=1 Tax=Brevibacillus sp. NPDC058079 TaxID=3346330 RepID=UPI0036E84812